MISLIIPYYNCETTVGKSVDEVLSFTEQYDEKIEFIAVNDGSTDGTLSVLKSYENNIRIVSYEKNCGKGGAIKAGILCASGDKIIFTDADLAYGLQPVKEISKALTEAPVAVGTRRRDDDISKSYGSKRTFFSVLFSKVTQVLLKLDIDDTQCGFKGYDRTAAKILFDDLHIMRFGFDVEILAKAKARNMKVVQIPVVLYKNEKNSKVHVIRDGIRMLTELFEIRRMIKKIKREHLNEKNVGK